MRQSPYHDDFVIQSAGIKSDRGVGIKSDRECGHQELSWLAVCLSRAPLSRATNGANCASIQLVLVETFHVNERQHTERHDVPCAT